MPFEQSLQRAEIERAWQAGEVAVLACSALKRHYRDILRAGGGEVRFVHLHGERDLIARRMGARTGHFMPPTLLPSQLQTLQPLGDGEDGVTIVVDVPPGEVADRAIAAFGLRPASSRG